MLINIEKFIAEEQKYWEELERMLQRLEADPEFSMDLHQVKRFHDLYQRASGDLAKISTFAWEKEIQSYLESLVARSYSEIYEVREKSSRFSPFHWFFSTFPQTFRRHMSAFWLVFGIMMSGSVFGGLAMTFDSEAKSVIMPFSHLLGDPSERVQNEEISTKDDFERQKVTFSSYLMTHNTKIAIFTLALGMTYGIGTLILLFYNGVILGGVAADYILAGETKFLLGWLLPHGVIEIPAILLSAQAGMILAGGLMGRKERTSLKFRLRSRTNDLMTLIFGAAIFLVWAGMIEAFLSQYHEPILPYAFKIGFGGIELILLILFLNKSGRNRIDAPE